MFQTKELNIKDNKMILRRIIFSITRKILKIFLMLSASSFSIKIQYFIYYFSENKENELFKLKQFISSKGNAIDIGCNKGLFSYALSKQSKIKKFILLNQINLF